MTLLAPAGRTAASEPTVATNWAGRGGASDSAASTNSGRARPRHRRRSAIGVVAGMPGPAAEIQAGPRLPRDPRDDAHRQGLGLEHRALLDVHFDIAEQFLAPVGRTGQPKPAA